MCEHCKDEYRKGEDESDFSENELLDELEDSDYYDEMKSDLNDRLTDQRNDLTDSGLIWTIYKTL